MFFFRLREVLSQSCNVLLGFLLTTGKVGGLPASAPLDVGTYPVDVQYGSVCRTLGGLKGGKSAIHFENQ
jgi:hypothetical protein